MQETKAIEILREMSGFLALWKDCLAGVQMTEKEFEETSGLSEAIEFLSNIEQEAKEEPLDKISTPDLIAELERRRPCPQNNCANNGDCTYCVWANGTMKDNFKEAK